MAFLCARWSTTLTPEQRTAWGDYASKQVMKNRLGEACYHSGFNHFIRSNMILKQSELPLVDDGPVFDGLPAHDDTLSVEASMTDNEITVGFDNNLFWAKETGAYMVCFQGMPQNAQRNFFAGPWRLLGHISGIDEGIPMDQQDFEPVFPIVDKQRQWIYARIIRKDGRLSEPFRTDCFVRW